MKATGEDRPLSLFYAVWTTLALEVSPLYALRLVLSSGGRAMEHTRAEWREFATKFLKEVILDSLKDVAKWGFKFAILAIFSIIISAIVGLCQMLQGASGPESFALALSVLALVWAILLLVWVSGLVVMWTWGRRRGQADISPNADAQELEILLGTWNIVILHDEPLRGTWTFRDDQKMIAPDGTVCGSWEMNPTEVFITWESYKAPPYANEHCWETFSRPLDRFGVTGKSWRPDAEVRANKVGLATPAIRAAQVAGSGHPGFFVGRWRLGVNSDLPNTFTAELLADRTAQRIATEIVPAATGSWEYIDGEAHIRWSDGWTDTLRVTKTACHQNGAENTAAAVKLADSGK